ncbi:MAG TPA: DUF456 domain-containing protein [Acidimicrobiia bacterium]|nr:DUF456 domain-containing protein [Acidimicrobiia bacterium]
MVGTVVPIIPGLVLQVIAVTIWAFEKQTTFGWVVLGVVLTLAATATALKYLYPGRRLKEAGVPGLVLFVAVVAGVIGLFVIPVVGAPLFFVLTIYAFERARRGRQQAWPSTKTALKAVVQSIGIELIGAFLVAVTFFSGVLLT